MKFAKLLISAILAAALVSTSGCSLLRPGPLTGVLERDMVWRGKIALRGDVVIAKGVTVTVAPGTEIIFLAPGPGEDQLTDHPHFPGSELIVRGRILARGTPAAPIVFRGADPAAAPGSWGGINLQECPEAVFAFCRFTQADSAVHSQESTVYVEQSLFENNLVALRFHTSEILIEHNLIRNNGTAIRFHFGAPVICNNEIRDNDKGFFITSFPRDYHIESNNIVASRRYSVVLGEEVPGDVGMARNYWGHTEAALIEQSLFDGRRTGYLGRVLFAPWARSPIVDAGTSWIR